ncbi:MAG: hypothetical protein GY827_12350 [Cytophagales bacterium]|nr:hypothetical protein [Cytophagales bacterium]
MKRFLFLCLYCLSSLVFAQEFQKGWVIMISGDTLQGEVNDDFSKKKSMRILSFRQNDVTRIIDKDSVVAYQKDSLYFVKLKYERPIQLIGGMMGFMQVIEQGNLTLLQFDYWIQSEPTGQKLSNSYIQTDYYLLAEGEKEPTLIKKFGFRKKMMKFFENQPFIYQQLKTKKWKYKHLQQIVKAYNQKKK